MDDLIEPHDFVEDCDCHRCAIVARDKHKAALRAMQIIGNARRAMEEGAEALDKLRSAPRAISAEADFDALTWTFQIARDCRVGAGTYALVWVGPNDRVEGRDAALSRRVPSHDGLGTAVPPEPTFEGSTKDEH